VFSSEQFCDFHRRLIVSHPECVQLVRVSAGDQTIGLLHNFVFGGTVHTYQCGFSYEEGNQNARPGLIVTAMAVEHCLNNTSLAYFDLMAGDGRYKKSLSTVMKQLGTYVVESGSVRCVLRNLTKRTREALVSRREVATIAPDVPVSVPAGTEDAE